MPYAPTLLLHQCYPTTRSAHHVSYVQYPTPAYFIVQLTNYGYTETRFHRRH